MNYNKKKMKNLEKALAKYRLNYKSLLLAQSRPPDRYQKNEYEILYYKVSGMESILEAICPEELLKLQSDVNYQVEQINGIIPDCGEMSHLPETNMER
jgi:hypothetical protein